MKPILFFICIILMAMIVVSNCSCSKQPENLIPIEKSITYLRHLYNDNGQYLATDTSIHFCKVSGEDLARFESKGNGEITFCGTYNRLELVIGTACKNNSK